MKTKKTKKKARTAPPPPPGAPMSAGPTPAAPPPPPAPRHEVDLPTSVKIHCPVCQTHWANAAIQFGEPILKGQFTPREDLKAKVKFQANGLPFCPVCNFKYDERAMYGLLIAAANDNTMERKLWGRDQFRE